MRAKSAGWRNPYLLAFRGLTDVINRRRKEFDQVVRSDERIYFIFDERSEKTKIIQAWDTIRESLPKEESALYAPNPRFENDQDFLPLQAADLWAWWLRVWRTSAEINQFQFPWESERDVPPKLLIEFDEDGLIEYLTDKGASSLPDGKELLILPKQV
jgi:hypothetical protein